MAAENVTIEHDVENLTINGRVTNLLINGEVVRLTFGAPPAHRTSGLARIESVLRAPTQKKLPDAFYDGPEGLDNIGQ